MFTLSIGGIAAMLGLGFLVGILSGMLGVGGGILVVPVLVLGFGFEQKVANGTSLLMICPPAGLPAILRYVKSGNVNVLAALVLMAGFVIGAWMGAQWANAKWMPADHLRAGFAFFILVMAGMMLFRSEPLVRMAGYTALIVAAYAIVYVGLRLLGRRWEREWPEAREIYRRQRVQPFAPDYEI